MVIMLLLMMITIMIESDKKVIIVIITQRKVRSRKGHTLQEAIAMLGASASYYYIIKPTFYQ